MTDTTTPTIVLVHGAFADASGFAGIIRELSARSYRVIAPSNPLRGLASDAAAVANVARTVDAPVVLVGHSYGGAVITQASAELENVASLVYLAAFAPAVGESCATAQAPYVASLLAETVRPTAYDAPGAAGGPDLFIDESRFQETFCADLPEEVAFSMAVSQRPLAAAAFTEPATGAGWTSIPTWCQIAQHDNAISPAAQRAWAARMGAHTEKVDGSHVAFISRPDAAAAMIIAAARA